MQNCKDIPEKKLFQYYNEDRKRHAIESGMMNEYIKEINGDNFTAKDFRTWSGTVNALIAIKEIEYAKTDKEYKSKMKEALEMVVSHLGNTENICREYYVQPLLINLYENNSITKYLDELDAIEVNDRKSVLTKEENLGLKIYY